MESNDLTLEEKCEMLMNVVVESRKRFGKMCIDYNHKGQIMENKMLSLQLETIGNYHFKSRNMTQNIDLESSNKDTEEFISELMLVQEKRKKLRMQIADTQNIVDQLKKDKVAKKIRQPFTAEVMLSRAKET